MQLEYLLTKMSNQCRQSSLNLVFTTGRLMNMKRTEMQSRRRELCESKAPGGQLGTQPGEEGGRERKRERGGGECLM